MTIIFEIVDHVCAFYVGVLSTLVYNPRCLFLRRLLSHNRLTKFPKGIFDAMLELQILLS